MFHKASSDRFLAVFSLKSTLLISGSEVPVPASCGRNTRLRRLTLRLCIPDRVTFILLHVLWWL